MTDEDARFFLLVIIALVIGNVFGYGFRTQDYKIKEGKEFILRNSTYKCIKTNELLLKK